MNAVIDHPVIKPINEYQLSLSLPELATAINVEHDAAERTARRAIEHARSAGENLLMAKAQVEHGQWLPWLSANCPALSARTARAYMQLSRNWGMLETKTADSANLSIDAALKLLNTPDPETDISELLPPLLLPAETATPDPTTAQHGAIVSRGEVIQHYISSIIDDCKEYPRHVECEASEPEMDADSASLESDRVDFDQLLELCLEKLPRGTGKLKDGVRKIHRAMKREISALRKESQSNNDNLEKIRCQLAYFKDGARSVYYGNATIRVYGDDDEIAFDALK